MATVNDIEMDRAAPFIRAAGGPSLSAPDRGQRGKAAGAAEKTLKLGDTKANTSAPAKASVIGFAAALVPDVLRTRSTYEKVSSEGVSLAGGERSTAPQAPGSMVLRVRWRIDRDNTIFRPAAWTAEGDQP
jgi:hypothetical protein